MGSDIAVLTSDNEGTPVSLIEAGAAGKPAVATQVGGVADVVTPESGFLVPPRDPAPFAEALVRLAHDRELRMKTGQRARDAVAHRFSVNRLLDDMDALYRELV
jgi:glycosyltransferase involved in cell wall biosynthesis